MTALPLQFGPTVSGVGGFVLFRLFGLVFAAVGLLVFLHPRAMGSRPIRNADGSVATIEPTGTQLLASRGLADVFVLLGLALFPFGPSSLLGFGPGF